MPFDDETVAIDLGDVVDLEHSRYGLSEAQMFRVLSLLPDAVNGRLTMRIWGPHDPYGTMALAPTLAGTGLSHGGSGSAAVAPTLAGTGTIT